MSKVELSISAGPKRDTLELRTQEEIKIPAEFYLQALSRTSQNPLSNALGCLDCARLEIEGQARLSRQLSLEIALIHPETLHPEIGQRFLKGDGFTIICPLIEPKNTHPDLREQSPPCKDKKRVTVDY